MRAMLLRATGGPENFEVADVAMPAVRAGEALVRIHAAALNPVDMRILNGLPIGPALPAVLGADLAGTVVATGEGVDHLKAGDEVYGCAGGVRGLGGTFAEHMAADARLLARKPRSLSMREAARFQAFPDDFAFTARLRETERQVGNAVPPVMAWHIANAVKDCLA